MADMVINHLQRCAAFSQVLVTGDLGDTITFPPPSLVPGIIEPGDVAGSWAVNPLVPRVRTRTIAFILAGSATMSYPSFAPYSRGVGNQQLGANPYAPGHFMVGPAESLSMTAETDGFQWYCLSPMVVQRIDHQIIRNDAQINVGPGGAFCVSIRGPARFDGTQVQQFDIQRTTQPILDVELPAGGLAFAVWRA